ncbi:flavoprotein [Actinoplanes cyaneus]|uniref:Flavoprotein n=1 Tax=Actinoplanes cyaneus TaxID=52696 RepID=A0A919ILT0_9ACTN|nr:flavoprotein [Actinoplanes cyaneus]GID64330.1 flavoprotein [Actinoplanes cyaneus]
MPVVALIVCGAPLARRVGDMAHALVEAGWHTQVVGTPMAIDWVDPAMQSALDIRFDFRAPAQQRVRTDIDALIICPATFNTANKIAAGIADNYAVSLACESIGQGLPVVMAPMVNNKLWGHFKWESTLAALTQAGVRLLDIQTGKPGTDPVESGSGKAVVSRFDPSWLPNALMHARN